MEGTTGGKKNKEPYEDHYDSVQKGPEIYEKEFARCHGIIGDGKGPEMARLNPRPTNFKDSHGNGTSDGEHFWKITRGRGPMPSFEKELTPEERWHVINYINTFNQHR